MRKEDRRAYLLHPAAADLVLNCSDPGPLVPELNDRDICLYCRRHQCIAACPTGALETRPDDRLAILEDRCISCGACVVACFEFTNITWRRRGIPECRGETHVLDEETCSDLQRVPLRVEGR